MIYVIIFDKPHLAVLLECIDDSYGQNVGDLEGTNPKASLYIYYEEKI